MAENVILEVEKVQKSFRKNTVLREISFQICDNDFVVLFGLPGSGKSLIFRLIMGLDTVDSGSIRIRGNDALPMLPGERNIGYVPQSFALFPDRSVQDNIGYPLTFTNMPRDEVSDAVEEVAKMLQIQDLLQKLPSQVSGGEKQRVAIARGLVKKTGIYILDDPLAGLDFKLRERLVDDLRALQEQLGATFLYATSDPMESLSLAKRVLALHEGRIVDDQDPHSIYLSPKHRFSAERMSFPISNTVSGKIRSASSGAVCELEGLGALSLPQSAEVKDGQPVTAVIKPEDIELRPDGTTIDSPAIRIDAEIQLREDLGGEQIVYLDVNGMELRSVMRHDLDDHLTNERAVFQIRTSRIGIFDVSTGAFIANSEELEHVGN